MAYVMKLVSVDEELSGADPICLAYVDRDVALAEAAHHWRELATATACGFQVEDANEAIFAWRVGDEETAEEAAAALAA